MYNHVGIATVAISSLYGFPERGIASERVCSMINAAKVRYLLFNWGKEDRRSSTPDVIKSMFDDMMSGGCTFPTLCSRVIADLRVQHQGVGLLQIASGIAALYVLHPPNSEISRATVLDQLSVSLEGKDIERQSPLFYQGCVLGLFLAASELGEGDDSCPALEKKIWSLAFQCSKKADFPKSPSQSGIVGGRFTGTLSNLLSDYFRSGLLSRRVHAENAILAELPTVFQKGVGRSSDKIALFPNHGMTKCLVGELVHKVFGHLSLGHKLDVIESHLRRK